MVSRLCNDFRPHGDAPRPPGPSVTFIVLTFVQRLRRSSRQTLECREALHRGPRRRPRRCTSSAVLTIETSSFPAATLCVWHDRHTFDESMLTSTSCAPSSSDRPKMLARRPSSPCRRELRAPRQAHGRPCRRDHRDRHPPWTSSFRPPGPTAKLPALLVHLDEARDHFGRRGDAGLRGKDGAHGDAPRPPGPSVTFTAVLHELSRRDPPRGKVASLVPETSQTLF